MNEPAYRAQSYSMYLSLSISFANKEKCHLDIGSWPYQHFHKSLMFLMRLPFCVLPETSGNTIRLGDHFAWNISALSHPHGFQLLQSLLMHSVNDVATHDDLLRVDISAGYANLAFSHLLSLSRMLLQKIKCCLRRVLHAALCSCGPVSCRDLQPFGNSRKHLTFLCTRAACTLFFSIVLS